MATAEQPESQKHSPVHVRQRPTHDIVGDKLEEVERDGDGDKGSASTEDDGSKGKEDGGEDVDGGDEAVRGVGGAVAVPTGGETKKGR